MMRALPLVFVFALALCFRLPAETGLSASPVAAVLQPFVDRQELAGAVAVIATKDNVLSVDAAGWADIAARQPMKAETMFWIASMTKPMTATALMMLVDEGKVSLDDPVEKFLPEFRGQMVIAEQDENHVLLKKPSHPFTVREALSHTAGLRFSSPLEQPTLDMVSVRDGVVSHALLPLQREPGSKYEYSNAGINAAGRIIEVVSNMPYEDFMRTRLFEPLGMKDTTFWPSEEQMQRMAKLYKPGANNAGLEETRSGYLTYPFNNPRRTPMPGGGLFSTAADVARFCQMVARQGEREGKRILTEASVKAMTSKQTPEAISEGYGLGWQTNGSEADFGHGGALATNMTIDMKRGLITVWLVQHAGFSGEGGKAHGAFRDSANARFGGK